MSADDVLMARKSEPGWINLAIGEPVFLQQALYKYGLYPRAVTTFGELEDKGYPPSNGSYELREALLENPETAGPLQGFEPDQMVITNGAKQALIASLWSLGTIRHAKSAGAVSPYWLSFPTISMRAGLDWMEWKAPHDPELPDIEITAWPNNPNGITRRLKYRRPEARIWDAVYASEVYGWTPASAINADVVVGSMSKTFGLSGLRLGWAAFRSRDEAAEAARFVETTTSGVSTLSQLYAEQFLEALKNRKDSYKLALAAAKRTLEMNSDAFRDMLCHVAEVEGAPAGHGGMFAWFRSIHIPQVFLGAAAEAKVNVVDGSCMGAPGWFRLSMGLSAAKTREALSRISEVLGG